MGALGKLRKLRRVLKGKGLRKKIGKLIGKAEDRLQKARRFIYVLKSAQIIRIVGDAQQVASQAAAISGAAGTAGTIAGSALGRISGVAGGVASIAGSAEDKIAQANGFLSSLDERLFRLGRTVYKRTHRILKLCAKVMKTISKFTKRIRKIVKIIRIALKVGKWIAKIIGYGKLAPLITKALVFVKELDDALRIVQRTTGQLAAICRDLYDQLREMNSKYEITAEDLIGLDSDIKVECISDRLYGRRPGGTPNRKLAADDNGDEFCDPDWDPEIDDDSVIDAELAELDAELDEIEFEVNEIIARRAPQTKNECMRFLADLDCVDHLAMLFSGLDKIESTNTERSEYVADARSIIFRSETTIRGGVGTLDFMESNFSPYDSINDKIEIASPALTGITDTVIDVYDQIKRTNRDGDSVDIRNIDNEEDFRPGTGYYADGQLPPLTSAGGIPVQGGVTTETDDALGIKSNDNVTPEYLQYEEMFEGNDISKIIGDEFVSRYRQGILLREALDYEPTSDLLIENQIATNSVPENEKG